MSVKVLLSFPGEFLKIVDQIAAEEHRSRSELVREAIRVYMENRQARKLKMAEGPTVYDTAAHTLDIAGDEALTRQTKRTPEQQRKIEEAMTFQDEIARQFSNVKGDSTAELRYWREHRKG